MIVFSPIRTRRLDVHLRELSFGHEIDLCNLPERMHEKMLSEFLARAVDVAGTPSDKHLANPRAWSVSERLYALAHYCLHTRDDRPDYAVTESSKLSDYLDAARDMPIAPASFIALEDEWVLHPLSGAAAEAIEALQFEASVKGVTHWLAGAMAAQLLRKGEQSPDAAHEFADYTTWLRERMKVIRAFPSTDMDVLFAHYREAVERDTQFFRIWFDEEGVVVLPKKEAGAEIPPARFHIFTCLGSLALSLTGKA